MSDSRLHTARRNLYDAFQSDKSSAPSVHSVTFQPCKSRTNADRIAVERYQILGQRWLFLLLCDGHGGTRTSEYTINYLPRHLAATLKDTVQEHLGGRVDRGANLQNAETHITAMLNREIVRFDRIIGMWVKEVFPEPHKLSKEDALRLIEEHSEVIERAFQGTTLSMAIVNMDEHLMWAAGVGDSTIALSTVDNAGVRHTERLCELHNFKNHREFFRAVMSHPSIEKDIVDHNNRLVGWLEMSRSIGDFPLKMDRKYLQYIFQYMPIGESSAACLLDRVRTPPYVIAKPSVRFVDLQPLWHSDPTLLLFSDGVDIIVDGYFTFTPGVQTGVDTLDVVPALLSRTENASLEIALGHGIEPRWSRSDRNLAVDILGNLLGGTDAEKLEMVMDQERLVAESPIFHIDDTTIVVARLAA